MIIGLLAIFAVDLADAFWVARLGTLELAALGFCFPAVHVIFSISLGLSTAGTAVMAQRIGAGNTDGARKFARDSLIVSILLMAAVATIGLLTMDLIFSAIGATGTTLAQVKSFMTVFYPSALVLVIPMVANGMLRGAGDTRWHYRERLISWSRPTWQGLVESLRHIGQIGLPSATTNAITPLATGLVTAVVAGFGDAAVAGLTTAMRIEVCALLGVFALAVGSFPVMAQNYGAGNRERLLTARKFTLSTGVVISLVVAIPVYLWAAPLAGIFISGGLVQETATTFLKIVPWSWAGFALVFMISSIHMATGRPFLGASLTLVRLIVLLIPLTWLLSRYFGLPGVFMAFVLANLLSAVAGLSSFYLFKQRNHTQ